MIVEGTAQDYQAHVEAILSSAWHEEQVDFYYELHTCAHCGAVVYARYKLDSEQKYTFFCNRCLNVVEKHCTHSNLDLDTVGTGHYSDGEIWDDIRDVAYCTDCGKRFDPIYLPVKMPVLADEDWNEIEF